MIPIVDQTPPLVYLDIDGVLRSDRDKRDDLRPACVALLLSIIAVTKALIVVSSTRRRSDDCLRLLIAAGIPQTAFRDPWRTPLFFSWDNDGGDTLDPGLSQRGQEIAADVLAHHPRRYVILDDMPVLDDQTARAVPVDPDTGLTANDAAQAIAILLDHAI